jgi:hypothetical protein
LPENFPALSPGLWMCDGSAGNPSGENFLFSHWLILFWDLPIRTYRAPVYNTGTYLRRLKEQPLIKLLLCCWHISPFWCMIKFSFLGKV